MNNSMIWLSGELAKKKKRPRFKDSLKKSNRDMRYKRSEINSSNHYFKKLKMMK
jgi:hypothetical protein